MYRKRNILKKAFSCLLAAACLISGTVCAWADETTDGQQETLTLQYSEEQSQKETDDQPDKPDEDDSGVKLGDVNHDGSIDSLDAVLVLRYAAGFDDIEKDYVKYGDFDNDGKLTSADAAYILRKSAGLSYRRLKIIDVSFYQGKIDWDTAKDYIDGAILRCGYGSDYEYQDDTQFERNLSECERLGIPIGVYLYSYAKTEKQAYSELEHILRLIDQHEFQLPIFLDCEQAGTEKFAPRACEIICEGLKEAGFLPGIYANTDWWTNYLTEVDGYIRWVAQYNTECTYEGEYLMWQYTPKGSIPGIDGDVDISYCYIEIEDFKNYMT